MARPRQPVELIMSKGAKHLTKTEIKDRLQTEVKPCADGIEPPSYLTAAQKKHFWKVAQTLNNIGIIGETDSEALARYVVAEELYRQAVKDCRSLRKHYKMPETPDDAAAFVEQLDKMDKRIDRYFKQAHTAASALGLTITSRCRLVVPKSDDVPKSNRFAAFDKKASGG